MSGPIQIDQRKTEFQIEKKTGCQGRVGGIILIFVGIGVEIENAR